MRNLQTNRPPPFVRPGPSGPVGSGREPRPSLLRRVPRVTFNGGLSAHVRAVGQAEEDSPTSNALELSSELYSWLPDWRLLCILGQKQYDSTINEVLFFGLIRVDFFSETEQSTSKAPLLRSSLDEG
ncbi:unnamed protein product [Protopolystoma xenopodis]|uniref:Uncharacterized protein n=1 Tax=Protopolystoma xenopodis TaxID=117903 RepID=A0A448XNP8_9PLAT|nr:unnamed protein product [Protopolystoma xenopodis]